ncbi:DUF2911 domain-containing protein [Roseivirga sp. E12]|uniref:DUF2911 domain-containing protein n=1 Tax=Roseivirga sp. E12 TaxID=2819237 RepID=UPI001ABC5B86|nr:DUF2911 domain-containing protein [Roseivirga sp. E12]MBO3697767.1 DUF2911 domain-containing protein [Roseivirga sp. E12]
MKVRFLIAIALVLFALPAAQAQKIKKSQKAGLTQTIAKTEISIDYYRPVARGRELFGKLVKYDKVWQPGANNATVFEISNDITVEGQKLSAGKYSLWSIPGKTEWVFIFSNDWDAWHTEYPEGSDALRVTVQSESGQHMETLAYYFSYIEGKEGTLNFHWGETIVPLRIKQDK